LIVEAKACPLPNDRETGENIDSRLLLRQPAIQLDIAILHPVAVMYVLPLDSSVTVIPALIRASSNLFMVNGTF
jgi:hypothetical protein